MWQRLSAMHCSIWQHRKGGLSTLFYYYIGDVRDKAKEDEVLKGEKRVIMREWDKEITPLDNHAMAKAAAVWRSICKPLGSLGVMEEMVIQLAGIFGTEEVTLSRRCVVVVCADNGVVAEGVTQSGPEVTASVAREIAEGRSNINIMAEAAGADTFAADVGMLQDVSHPALLQRKIAGGTANITEGPAMTKEQAVQGIEIGMELVRLMKERKYQIIVTGEMGIGNTTTSSAMAAVLLGREPGEMTGRGAGLSSEGLRRKKDVVRKAVNVNHPDRKDPLDVLAKLGGFDVAAMVGIFLGGAVEHIPVVIDGLISSIAALLACELQPACKGYLLPSHMTEEPAGAAIMERLGFNPVLHAEMRLGEGTGGVCLLPFLDIALAEYHKAHRFEETDVEQYQELQ